LAKIAVEQSGGVTRTDAGNASSRPAARLLARGDGWAVRDLVCTSGPHSRPFEERHSCPSVSIVVAGTFQYRSPAGCELLTPGSLLLGNAGQSFECGHEHSTGDRCVSFSYTREFFERLSADAGATGAASGFRAQRVPPLRILSPLVARACSALAGSADTPWEQLSVQLAAQALRIDRGLSLDSFFAQPGAVARVTQVVRMIERYPDGAHALTNLAREARLSPYHFLRIFEQLTGVTPHQYLLRVRLRRAAIRLSTEPTKILDIALDCGFGDVSNFNRTFRAEFGVNPRAYRTQTRGRHVSQAQL
jgi:AraC family transcriptional regulator